MDAIESFLQERYYHQGEDWNGLCNRVASLGKDKTERRRIYNMIHSKRGIPSTPILMNAGRDRPFMSACSLIPVPDNLSGIMDAIKTMALIQKQGGGCCAEGTVIPTIEYGFIEIEKIPHFKEVVSNETPYPCTPFHVFSFDQITKSFVLFLC